VCLGVGTIKSREDVAQSCPRCAGSGACPLCQTTGVDLEAPQRHSALGDIAALN